MRLSALIIVSLGLLGTLASCGSDTPKESTRRERRLINAGNKEYSSGHFAEAMTKYKDALEESPNSAEAKYNLGLSQLRRAETIEADSLKQAYMQSGTQLTADVARRGSDRPLTASKASYNLGNGEFTQEQYDRAIEMYKQALRLNPDDEAARRNLRIAQLKKQEQDQNQDKNQDNQDKQDKQDQQQDQQNQDQQDQNQDQQDRQNQDRQQDQQPPQQQEQQINQAVSDQILKAMENKENATRARVMKGQNGQEAAGSARHRKNW